MSLRFHDIHSRNPRILQPPTRKHFPTSARQSSTPTTIPVRGKVRGLSSHHDIRITSRRSCEFHLCFHTTFAMDDDSMVVPSLLDESDGFSGRHTYLLSSSEGEESDGDLLPGPVESVDLPVGKERLDGTEGALTVTAHRLATLRGHHRRRGGIQPGALINFVLLSFLSMFTLLVDWCSWKIIRQPLQPFYLTRPFLIAFALSASAGWFYIPLLRKLKFYQVIRKEGPSSHASKKGTPTMGGLFFIPIGISVACVIVGFNSVEVCGAAIVTLAYAAIGFLDDLSSFLKSHNYGLPGFIKFFLQAAAGIGFCFWLDSANISSPYIMYNFPL